MTDVMESKITTTVHANQSVLGGAEWRPELVVRLDEDGACDIYATQRHSSEFNSTPMDVWHGQTLRWREVLSQGTRVIADTHAIESLAVQLQPLLERVHAGHSVEWDDHNMCGRLDGAARDASDEIKTILETFEWTLDEEIEEDDEQE